MPDKEIMVQIREREEQRPWRSLDALTDDPRTVPGLINALGSLVDDWRATADLYEKAKLKGAQTAYVVPLRHAAAELDKVIKGLEQPRRAPLGQLQPERIPSDRALPAVDAGLDEPVHRFEVGPGATGRTCTAMVERDGVGDQCGRFASHPAHRMQTPAANPAGLDALIADSVAKHKALDAEGGPDFPGQASGEEVAAYLRGETDDLPGEPLQPSSVRDQTVTYDSGDFHAAQNEEWARDERAARAWRVLVTGSRTWTDADMIHRVLAEALVTHPHGARMVVVHGACPSGADAIADAWAKLHGVGVEPYPADWDGFGPGAGPMRNQAMVDTKPDECVAFIRDASKGATHCADAAERAGIPITRFMYPDPAEPLSDPARNFARTILETMPVSAIIPPVPLLGQPGNAGAGYDHAYVPPGGVPATYAELMTPVPAAALPAHISHSQIETAGDCGVKYRLQRLPRLGANNASGVAETEQIPQWALIGGNALHAAIEDIERHEITEPGTVVDRIDPEKAWRHWFDAECQKIEATSPVPRSRWRGSRAGSEGETWWNANGPLMIERYLKARPAEPTAGMPRQPQDQWGALEDAIELERTVAVPTPYGPIAYRMIIDRITVRPPERGDSDVTLIIRDYKSGDRMPDSTQQLGEYAQVLRLLGVPPSVRILGSYFNARKGTWTPEVDLEAAGWTAEWFAYHVASGHAERLKLTVGPTPARPSSFCGGCSVRWACPVKNGARR